MLQEYNNQKQRVMHYLRCYTSIDPLESWTELGIYRLSACIHTLRKEGYKIITKRKDVTNRFGEKCNVADYHLSSNIEAQNKIDFNNIQVLDMDYLQSQYPEYEDSFVVEAEWKDTGVTLTDEEIDAVNNDRDFVYETLQDFLH